jgi:large subunit ribosomal protein L24
VQTALLSAGIAIILALLTALVGPFFVDWDGYRTEFETRVAKLTGLEVRVTGPIDLRILPTPTVTLRQIELGRPGDPAKTRAQALRIEFALGDLLRGEWRAPDLKLQGPELSLGLDASGRLAWSAPTIGLDPDAVSIDHIEIANGRAIFADAGSGARLVLEDLQFAGQVRSLVGPVKGEGSFIVDGRHYPFRLSVARPSDDGGVKVRLNLDPVDYPRAVDVDGSIWVERGVPRFEGTMQVVRPVGRGPDGIVEPWRFASRVNVNGTGVVLQQVELQYGAEERAIRLKGDAKLTFGAAPELVAALSAPQLDLDRILALPEAEERRPLVAVRSLVESIVRAQHLPVPVKLAISAETVTLAGAMLQRLGGDLKSDGDNWDIEKLTFRAPGLSQVALSGRLDATPGGIVFRGATRIDSADPRALAGWLADRGGGPATPTGALHVAGDIALGGGKIVLDRLQADFDRTKVEGHLDYAWPNGDQPAKLNATLHASELDLDRAQSLALASLGDIEWPRQGSLAIDIGRAMLSGVEATDVAIKMRRDAGVLDIERLAVGDIGGTKLSVGGRIDTNDPAPHGGLTLDLDARGLDGLTALIEKLSPTIADRIRRSAGRAVPVKLHTSFTLDHTGSAGAPSVAKLRLQGSAGTFRLSMQGDADGARVASIDPAQMGATKVHLVGSIDAGDGGALVELLGLDRLVTVSERSGRLTLDLNGPIDGDMAVKSELAAGGLNVTARGTFNPSGRGRPTAELALSAAAADLVAPRSAMVRRTTQPPWSEMTARLTLADNTLRFTDLRGTLAGIGIDGEVGIGIDAPMRMNGNIAIGSLDLPATIGAVVGFPRQNGNRDSLWSADPFEAGELGAISGRIAIKAGQVALTSKLSARNVRAVVDLHDSELTVADIEGALAGGSVAGDFAFKRGDEGMATHSHFKLADVEAAELLGGVRPPVSGKLSAELELAGSGRSPIALIGSLKGEGKLTLRDGSVARFDPGAFDAVTRAIDQGLPIDTTRIGERMEAALAVGGLSIVLAQGSIDASLGQLRLVDLSVQAKGAEFAPAGSIDLTQGAIDARLVLSALKAADAKTGGPPDISVALTGPLDMPKRTLEVAALSNWLARRAADQKAKRVDALEQAARENPIEGAGSPAEPAEHEGVDTPAGTTPPRRLVRPNPTTAPIANPLTSSVAPAVPRSRAGPDASAPSSGVDGAKPGDEQPPRQRRPASAEQSAPLAPPLDIRPTSRAPRGENAPRPDNGAKGEGGPHSLQPLRSIFPGLFGP